VRFAFTDFEIKSDKKWSAKCKHCCETITETCGTSSGFVKHVERKHAAVLESYNKSKGFTFILFRSWHTWPTFVPVLKIDYRCAFHGSISLTPTLKLALTLICHYCHKHVFPSFTWF